jgi:hypothetical protein
MTWQSKMRSYRTPARDLAVDHVRARRSADVDRCYLVGEMENELAIARLARADMVATGAIGEPNQATTNRITIDRTLVGSAAIRTVEGAMAVLSGAAL